MTTGSIGPGTVLGGRYRLDDLLSESDGARFWRGTDTVLGRSVAVNVMPGADPRAPLLLRAARTSATVTESRLLRVLDCDEASGPDGVTWVVNEWGWGTSLDIMLQRGVLPASRAAWLAREVAETIAAAHRLGVAHGRLNPESVLITEAGSVKLIGFVVTAAIEGPASAGTPDARRGYGVLDPLEADVIDLAGILYAATTGRWPGISPSAVPVAPFDHRGPLRPRQVRAGVPRMLDALCERVLRREAHAHVQPIETAQEILAALADEVGDPMVGSPTSVASMYVEPSATTHPDELPGLARAGDPEATQASPPPTWDSPTRPALEEPDLPPYEELPDRPLFASAERRTPLPAAAVSADRGSPVWLFGDDDPVTTAPSPTPKRRHPFRIALIAVAVVVLLVAMTIAFELGHRGSPDDTSSATPPPTPSATPIDTTLHPVGVSDFDPDGKNAKGRPAPHENTAEVPLATDGDPETGWTTVSYASSNLGGLKPGVGLLVDLGTDRSVASIDLTLRGAPTRFEIYATPAGVSVPPANLGDTSRIGGMTARHRSAVLDLATPTQTRYVVIWLTKLPKHGHRFRGEIDELVLHS